MKTFTEDKNNAIIYKNKSINNIIDENQKEYHIKKNNDINKKSIKEQKNYKEKFKDKSNNIFENKKYVKVEDYLENLNLIITKNSEKKNWLVLNKNNSIIRNFNNEELLKFLKERENIDKSLEHLTVNDYDTDIVFPAKAIYENLKDFFSHEI